MAILVKGEHRTYFVVHQEKGTTPVYKSFTRVYTLVKIKSMAKSMGTRNDARREVQYPLDVRWNLATRIGRSHSTFQ